jgi:hypothetical protein
MRIECEKRLAAAEEERATALERLRTELVGSAAEQAALREEQEKEARIEMLRRQSMRRMLNQDLAWGWTAWLEMWDVMRRLREIGGKLRSPELSAAFTSWADVSSKRKQALAMATLEKQSKSLESQLRQSEHDAGQLRMIKVVHEDEIDYLKGKLSEAMEEVKAKNSDLKRIRPQAQGLTGEIEHLKKLLLSAHETTATAERKRKEAEEDTKKQRHANQQLLEKLVAEHRKAFAGDLEKHKGEVDKVRQQVTSEAEKRSRIEKELASAKGEVQSLQRKLDAKMKAESMPIPRRGNTSVLGNVEFDEGPDAPPIAEQIGMALRKGATRVLDLFREWDKDGDGNVSRQEFLNAMPRLGFNAPKRALEELFDSWDKDGGGSLTLRELQKILRSSGGSRPGSSGSSEKLGGLLRAASAASKMGATTKRS